MPHTPARLVASALMAAASAIAFFSAQAQPPQRSLAYISEPGDPVGQGRTATALPRFRYAKSDAV